MQINNRSIEQASEVVFLVVVLDEHLIWKPHISMLHVKFLRLLVYFCFDPSHRRSTTVSLETTNSFIKINNRSIEQASEVVFLVFVLDEHLIWNYHVARKISQTVGILYKASFFCCKLSLCTLYYLIGNQYLFHCIAVWGSTYPTSLKRLVTLQRSVVRSLTKTHLTLILTQFLLILNC